ncbi:MAG TPA: complex I NDUFA9 subunit family protein [Usitatibacter sp.]|nr:complex I NDUFA9 subunit family protein [Usitatibacter sp.]
MDIESVCIIGGTGFVGRSVADHIAARGMRVRVVTRSAPRARGLLVLPTLEVMVASPHDEKDLERAFDGMDAVVNLAGILHESGRATFEAVHAELPRKIVKACRAAGVLQLLHMSALGASADGPSKYQRSKAAGEQAVRAALDMAAFTIFRPSVIFGEHDRFLNLFASLVRVFPVVPLAGAKTRFQPVWVEDVARAFAGSLGNPAVAGRTYALCGPRAYTLEELVRFVATTVGRRPGIVALPPALATLQAMVFEHLPGKLVTRDNLASMKVDNVCADPWPAELGFKPSSLEAVAAEYLADAAMRGRYQRFRHFAGRG